MTPLRTFFLAGGIIGLVSLAGFIAYYSSFVNIKVQKYESVQRIYVRSDGSGRFGTTLDVDRGNQTVEPVYFRLASPIYIIDVPAGKEMWAELKKCEKDYAGCLELHVRTLNDIQHVGVSETRSSE